MVSWRNPYWHAHGLVLERSAWLLTGSISFSPVLSRHHRCCYATTVREGGATTRWCGTSRFYNRLLQRVRRWCDEERRLTHECESFFAREASRVHRQHFGQWHFDGALTDVGIRLASYSLRLFNRLGKTRTRGNSVGHTENTKCADNS